MFYRVNKEDGYIHGVVKGVNAFNSNISEDEYVNIKEILKNAPTAHDGFYYRLKENLEWELCELKSKHSTTTIIQEGEYDHE